MAICEREAYAAPKDHLNVTFTAGHQDRQNLLKMKGVVLDKVGEIRYHVPLCPDCSPIGKFTLLWLLCCLNSEKTAVGRRQHLQSLSGVVRTLKERRACLLSFRSAFEESG
ncbi:hypothetical protein J3458_020848 [Metarhizium acridum]|uniref:uncharacterized protein n=1 Tax=Metarhizium acridum TaxID=92637 RepID=UPI001C6AA3BC|nr:hypothetical protein J3458_020848 [Metarhizium acridum]